MDKNVEKTVKNALAVVGALAVVKAAPVLAAGAAIGVAVSNADKIKNAVNDFVGRIEAEAAKHREEAEAAAEELKNNPWGDVGGSGFGNDEDSASEEDEGDLYDHAEPVPEETDAETQQPENADEAPKSKEELADDLLNTLRKLFET